MAVITRNVGRGTPEPEKPPADPANTDDENVEKGDPITLNSPVPEVKVTVKKGKGR